MTERHLRTLSILYLLVPNLLFFFNWVNLPFKVVGILLLCYAFFTDVRYSAFSKEKVLNLRDLVIVGFASLLLTFVSGINGICYQTFDYWCHNTKFYELLSYQWPIRIPQDGPVISYYYGFYVVPVLFSKLTGTINESVIFVWTWLGFMIGVLWVYLVLNKRIFWVFLALCIGDLPHVIKSTLYKFSVKLYEFGDFGVENWSNMENLLWVPNQVIPTLIIGGILVYTLKKGLNINLVVLPVALSFWWAIFPAFVSGLLVGILIFLDVVKAQFRIAWGSYLNRVAVPFLACLPILVFYLSHAESPVSGFLWEFVSDPGNVFVEYLVNISINAALFTAAYFCFRKLDLPSLPSLAFVILIIFTVLFPLFRLGKVNDFLFRGMMPVLIIAGMYLFYPLTVYSAKRTFEVLKTSGVSIALVVLLASSSIIGVTRFWRAATVNQLTVKMGVNSAPFTPIPYDAYPNIYEVLKDKWSQQEANQYLGKSDSFYEKHMAPSKN